MKKKEENIINPEDKEKDKEKKENEDDEWESIPENEQTEETKDILYRLNIEKASKVKIDIHKLKNYHSIKVKKLEKKEIESFYNLDTYIKEKYLPNITINHNSNTNPYITILNTDYILKKNPEIGTYLIYELDDKNEEVNLIGKSDTWYEATIVKPKLILKKPNNQLKIQNKKINKGFNFVKKNILKINKNENNVDLNLLNKKRKRKKKKRKYPKDSTVIEIKRIFDNKDNEKEENIKNNNDKENNDKKEKQNIKIEI